MFFIVRARKMHDNSYALYIYYGYTTTPRVLLILESTKYAYFVAGAIFLRLCILCIPLSIKLFYHTALY